MYVYVTDGYGNDNLMDDANMPNLTVFPNFGWCADDDPVYLNTRSFTLSSDDPYYFGGKYATGLGSPHTPHGWVWPLGLMGAAFSTTKRKEVEQAIDMLDRSDTLNGLMHESVNPNDPSQFTRPEFGWANAFWADLLFRTVAGYRVTSFVIDTTIVPFEHTNEMPAITPLFTQLSDTGEINFALTDLLTTHRQP
jgi:meiotically up-regulated gene 157 (Mug157) protein